MNHFYESFQKELGKRLAQVVSAVLTCMLSAAAFYLPKNMHALRLTLICLAVLSFIALAKGLLLHYRKYRTSKHKVEDVKINHQTCEWIQDPGIWKHRASGLYYCPHCAPNPSPLSSERFCPNCSMGFGEGTAFIVND